MAGPAAAGGPPLLGLSMTPVTPCRVLDTRPGAGAENQITGPLAAGAVYGFEVVGRCGVPADARAAVLNFIAVGPAGPGHLSAWPWEDGPSAPPVASIINYAALGGLNVANSVDLALCDPSTITDGDCDFDLFLRAAASSTHVVVDVTGYYAERVWGEGRPGAQVWPDFYVVQLANYCNPNGVRFGLSKDETTWDGAAAACPRGWWVCTREERGNTACDTERPDDGLSCDVFDCQSNCEQWEADEHLGWVADTHNGLPKFVKETGAGSQRQSCHRLPVWCCR
jgi:hypothetical protein